MTIYIPTSLRVQCLHNLLDFFYIGGFVSINIICHLFYQCELKDIYFKCLIVIQYHFI